MQKFIADKSTFSTCKEKNKHLSTKLCTEPYVSYKITKIERSSEQPGWIIYYD